MNGNFPQFRDLYEMFLGWPTQTQSGLLLSVSLWIIGGNILSIYSLKRRGIPLWNIIVSSPKVAFGFNRVEWAILACLAVASLSSAMWGISAQY